MSGGSYNYLFQKDSAEIISCYYDLEKMAQSLERQGYQHAAIKTREVLTVIDDYHKRMDPLLEHLCSVWEAEECLESRNGSMESLRIACENLEGRK